MFIGLFKRLDIEAYSMRQKIELLEWWLKRHVERPKTAAYYDYQHIIENGLYLRLIKIPAGDLVIGMVHKTRHMNYLLSGHAAIVCDEFALDVTGPYQFVSPAECKKAVYAYTDVVYATTHVTDKTDLAAIMQETVYDSDLRWIEGLS